MAERCRANQQCTTCPHFFAARFFCVPNIPTLSALRSQLRALTLSLSHLRWRVPSHTHVGLDKAMYKELLAQWSKQEVSKATGA